jgi:hypothetical protein
LSALELIPIFNKHRPFIFLSALGLALLYAEETWAAFNFWSHRSLTEGIVFVAVIAGIAFLGYLISFFFPPTLVSHTWDHPRPWGVFIDVTFWSAGITIAFNVMIYILLIILVQFDFTASYNLLRDMYVYTLFGLVFFHGMLLYVRYMHYLYSVPDYIQPAKVIAVSVGLGVVMLVVAGFLFMLDLYHFENAPVAIQPMMGLHIYARAIYAFTLALAAFGWHLRWIADH